MTAEVQRLSTPSKHTHAPRKLRNYLLDPKFQLKYTSMVVGVALAVGGVLGYEAYKYSTGQTELLNIQKMESRGADVDAPFLRDLEAYSRAADRQVLTAIIGGVAALALALGVTGIVVTHRLVGPAFRLRQLFGQVTGSRIRPVGNLRKHDELQEVYGAFQEMIGRLRAMRAEDVQDLDLAIEKAEEAGMPGDLIESLKNLRDRIRGSLA
jgi:hypothetical protein